VRNTESFFLYSYLTAGIKVYGLSGLEGIVQMYSNVGQASIYNETPICPAPEKHTVALPPELCFGISEATLEHVEIVCFFIMYSEGIAWSDEALVVFDHFRYGGDV
jgi:hypothetical protein